MVSQNLISVHETEAAFAYVRRVLRRHVSHITLAILFLANAFQVLVLKIYDMSAIFQPLFFFFAMKCSSIIDCYQYCCSESSPFNPPPFQAEWWPQLRRVSTLFRDFSFTVSLLVKFAEFGHLFLAVRLRSLVRSFIFINVTCSLSDTDPLVSMGQLLH